MGENQFVGILTGSIPGDVTQLYYRIPRNDWEKSVGQDTCMQCNIVPVAFPHITGNCAMLLR